MIVTFDSATESWNSSPVWSTTKTRIGADSLRQAPTGGNTIFNEAIGTYNLGDYSGSDQFLFAYNNDSTNTAAVGVRFKVDDSNYYQYSLNNPSVGYHVDSIAKANMSSQGNPTWAGVTKVQVYTTAKASLVATVDWDGIRVSDTDSVNPNYVLVAREVLATPFSIKGGSVNEIEFSMAITV